MFNKLYVEVKAILKKNYKFFLVLIILGFICNIQLPLYIDAPGGLIDVSKRISISDSYEVKGSLNLAYVSEFKATVPTLIWSYFDKNWDLLKVNDVVSSNETIEQNEYRNHLLLEEANQNAIYVGFNLAGEYVNITNNKVYVVYTTLDSKTDLQIRDQIIKVNGIDIGSKKEINNIINKCNSGDIIKFTVLNNNQTIERTGTVQNFNGFNVVGIVVSEIKDIDTNRDINFNFKSSESGPSGGFMMSLAIYNYLTENDITHGLKIAGTGTIDADGNVGTIGGIEYKIKGAIKNKVDVFFVPAGENYEDAYKLVNENNLNINLVKVSNIKDAIDYLNNL